ncbi:MAG TPA: alpha/beta hydrolase, partial [Anaerolineae bacterium]|nr:alpha/beta hydrolase [Anaerolineae bacterium]
MPSLQSQLIIFAIRNRHFLRFRSKRESWDDRTSIPDFRQQCEAGARRMKLPDGIEVLPVTIDGVTGIANRQAEWLIPDGALKDKVILYTVGGGYVSGSCSDHRAMVAKITKGSGVRTLLFDHRLAPEDPFPAALEDSVAAYRWLLAGGISPSNIVIVGDSAGGGLCLATLLALRDQSIPLPVAAVALSPWTDLALTGASYRTKLEASIDPPGMSVVCRNYYVGENDPCLPWISPLYGDLQGLPPIFICVGTNETMLDDSTRFAEKAKAAGVDVTLRAWKGMVHCFPLMAPLFPEATQALAEICAFIKTHIG